MLTLSMWTLLVLIAGGLLSSSSFISAVGAPPPTARAPALADSLSSRQPRRCPIASFALDAVASVVLPLAIGGMAVRAELLPVPRRRLRIVAAAALVVAVVLFLTTVTALQWLALALVLGSTLLSLWTLLNPERGDA